MRNKIFIIVLFFYISFVFSISLNCIAAPKKTNKSGRASIATDAYARSLRNGSTNSMKDSEQAASGKPTINQGTIENNNSSSQIASSNVKAPEAVKLKSTVSDPFNSSGVLAASGNSNAITGNAALSIHDDKLTILDLLQLLTQLKIGGNANHIQEIIDNFTTEVFQSCNGTSSNIINADAGLAVDWDGGVEKTGLQRSWKQDRAWSKKKGRYIQIGQGQTSLSWNKKDPSSGTKYANAFSTNYVVIPVDQAQRRGVKVGDICMVKNNQNGKATFAIVADTGPKWGEGSASLAKELGIKDHYQSGGQESDVNYQCMPNSRLKNSTQQPFQTNDDIKRRGSQLFCGVGGSMSGQNLM